MYAVLAPVAEYMHPLALLPTHHYLEISVGIKVSLGRRQPVFVHCGVRCDRRRNILELLGQHAVGEKRVLIKVL
jgi:hypothetical protein